MFAILSPTSLAQCLILFNLIVLPYIAQLTLAGPLNIRRPRGAGGPTLKNWQQTDVGDTPAVELGKGAEFRDDQSENSSSGVGLRSGASPKLPADKQINHFIRQLALISESIKSNRNQVGLTSTLSEIVTFEKAVTKLKEEKLSESSRKILETVEINVKSLKMEVEGLLSSKEETPSDRMVDPPEAEQLPTSDILFNRKITELLNELTLLQLNHAEWDPETLTDLDNKLLKLKKEAGSESSLKLLEGVENSVQNFKRLVSANDETTTDSWDTYPEFDPETAPVDFSFRGNNKSPGIQDSLTGLQSNIGKIKQQFSFLRRPDGMQPRSFNLLKNMPPPIQKPVKQPINELPLDFLEGLVGFIGG